MFNTIRELKNAWPTTGFVIYKICELDLDGDFFKVYVYGDTLEYPVFHVIDVNTKTDVAVSIFEPRFYQYSHDTSTDSPFLTDLFDKAMREKNTSRPNSKKDLTNWETVIDYWCREHTLEDKYKGLTQPDYTKLEDNKIVKRSFARMLIAKWNA